MGQLNPAIAGLMGRRDLSRRGSVTPIDTRRVTSDAPGYGDDAGALYSPGASGDVNTGRISLGMVGGIVVGLAAFYLWTRTHQA